ncbi:MAG: HEAT repeat domain-containing protein [Pirellulales bacterium]
MNYSSRRVAAAPTWLIALAASTAIVGCKSAPVNPFAAQPPTGNSAAPSAKDTDVSSSQGTSSQGTSGQASQGAMSQGTMPATAASARESLAAEGNALARLGAGVASAAVGLGKEVKAVAHDAASRVRLAAAHTVADQSQQVEQAAAHAVDTARSVATQAAAQFQQQAVNALAERPIEQAGPILLLAIAEGDAGARRAAAAQLAQRWPPAKDFPVEAAAESRERAVAELRQLWAVQYGQLNDAANAQLTEARQLIELTAEQAREAQQLLATLEQTDLSEEARRQATAALVAYGPPLVHLLDRQLAEHVALPETLYNDVLPNIKPAFAAVSRLQASDPAARRQAAKELASLAAAGTLPPIAVERLALLLEAERDPAVLQQVLVAVRTSTHQAAERMAYQALANTAAEVRVEACNYLAAHGDPRHVDALLRTLADPQAEVQRAAVRALGSVGRLEDSAPLEALLAAEDQLLKLESALALARLQVASGQAALERLAIDSDAQVRLRAAQAMGEIGDPLFAPALLAMLGDQAEVQQAALRGLTHIAGRDVTLEAGAAPSDVEKVARWRRWYAEQQAGAVQTSSGQAEAEQADAVRRL